MYHVRSNSPFFSFFLLPPLISRKNKEMDNSTKVGRKASRGSRWDEVMVERSWSRKKHQPSQVSRGHMHTTQTSKSSCKAKEMGWSIQAKCPTPRNRQNTMGDISKHVDKKTSKNQKETQKPSCPVYKPNTQTSVVGGIRTFQVEPEREAWAKPSNKGSKWKLHTPVRQRSSSKANSLPIRKKNVCSIQTKSWCNGIEWIHRQERIVIRRLGIYET